MAEDSDSREDKATTDDGPAEGSPSISPVTGEGDLVPGAGLEARAATQLGTTRYVHAAFFVLAILAAFVAGKVLLSVWNALADWPAAVRAVPLLLQYTEEERGTLTLVAGAILGALAVLRYYRRPSTRAWADAVAAELGRVTWPERETVTSGTLVVLIAGAVGTLYVTVLDRFWAYLTNLVYGA